MVLLHKYQLGEEKNAQKDFIYEIISPQNVTQSPENLLEQRVLSKFKGHNKRTLLAATGFSV